MALNGGEEVPAPAPFDCQYYAISHFRAFPRSRTDQSCGLLQSPKTVLTAIFHVIALHARIATTIPLSPLKSLQMS